MKHIFCDLDGTLLLDFERIEDRDINALLKAEEKGYQVSIATGRLDYEIQALIKKYGLKGRYRVSQNGGIIFEDDDLIYASYLTQDELKQTMAALESLPVITFIQTAQHYYVQKKTEIVEKFEKLQPFTRYDEMPDLYDRLDELSIVTVSLWTEKDENRWIREHLLKRIPDTLEPYITSEYTIDITHRINSKGRAIKILSERNQISPDDIYVIGDSYNDVSMFEFTKNSFAMAIADDEVKRHANTVVSTVEEAVEIILNNG